MHSWKTISKNKDSQNNRIFLLYLLEHFSVFFFSSPHLGVFKLQPLPTSTAGGQSPVCLGLLCFMHMCVLLKSPARGRPLNEPLTPVFREQNHVCSCQSVGVEGAQRICVAEQCFNGAMRERPDGAVCRTLVLMWDLKSPDQLLHSSPLTS